VPAKFETTLAKIQTIPNKANADMVLEFLAFMKENGSSERHQHNQVKALIPYAIYLGNTSFQEVSKREQITGYLDTKIKSEVDDPEKRWIGYWNDLSLRIKSFYRWLHNQRGKEELIPTSEWETPTFAKIRLKKTKRLSPYADTEIWDLEELLAILPYEPQKRNKAALMLFWDLDARNHEVTLLKIKNLRFREKYAEGSIPDSSKTGSGPILLTASFPWVRDWINEHPFKDEPDARVICNLYTGQPVKPDAMWNMMHALKQRIIRLLKSGEVKDPKEREKLEFLLKTKRWNPYVLRHSSITHDSEYLPEFALRRKVRWSMNSKMPSRYLKKRWGQDLKRTILRHNGIVTEDVPKLMLATVDCPRCQFVNTRESKVCGSCAMPLSQSALDEIKAEEDKKIQSLQEQLRDVLESQKEIQELLKNPQKLQAMLKENEG
jgi:hypothetical protein